MSNRGDRLRSFRENLGLSQKAFSEKLETAQRNISKYETGMTSIPDDIEELLARCGLNLHWLATGEGPMFTGQATPPDTPEPTAGDDKYETIAHLTPATPHGQPAAPPVQTAPEAAPVRIVRPGELTGRHFLVPLLDQRVSAGPGAALPDADTPVSYIPAPAYLSRYGSDVAALQVRGDSMEPTLKEGDMVVCDTYG